MPVLQCVLLESAIRHFRQRLLRALWNFWRYVDSSSLHWQLQHGSRPVSRCAVQCKYWISFGLVTRCWAAKTEHFAIHNWEHKIRNSQCSAGLAWPRRVFATINKSVICPISDNDTQHHGSSSSRQRWDQLIKTLPSPGRAIKTRLEQQLIIKLWFY